MTLPEIAAYLKGWQKERNLQTMYFGTLTAAIYNTAPGRKGRRPLKWTDIYHVRTDSPSDSGEKWEMLKRIFPQKNTET